jgi:amino acid adenylation domain-containing protein
MLQNDSALIINENREMTSSGDAECVISESESALFVALAVRGHAASRPSAPAVVSPAGTLTYGQLYDRAARLAARLARSAPGQDDVVAICLAAEASIGAALAAMLAGRPYLLIDPGQPRVRALHMLRDCQAKVVVTDDRHRHVVEGYEIPPIPADSPGAEAGDNGALSEPTPGDLAYICYTSGSSGQPKGVMVTQHGLANLIAWYTRFYGITPADRMTQLASPSFDAWTLEVWPCLANGATLHLAGTELTRSPERLRDWLTATEITVCFVPTPLAVQLLALPWKTTAEDRTLLRAMLTGGDRMVRPPARRPPFRLFNNYGPTECTVVASCGEVLDFGSQEPPPIGRPIPSVHASVLLPDGQSATAGVIGELVLGGAAVARGYAGDARPGGFLVRRGPGPVGRLYRTGDLVTQDEDGVLHFVGRVDSQLQVNGVRVEPREVENVLMLHSAVRDAAVVAHHSSDDAVYLVGYVVTDGDIDEPALRRHMETLLPPVMTPHRVIAIDALPVTFRGKVDRDALARRELPAVAAGREQAEDTQGRLGAIWAEVLRVPAVSADDDFFELGGDSLRTLQFINKARSAGFTLTPEHLYMQPVLADLARLIDEIQAEDDPNGS